MSDERPRSPLDGSPTVDRWAVEEDRELVETRIFTLRQVRARRPGREPGEFVYMDSVDWVNVVALTDERQVVLVEQYRHGLREVTVEIPGGLLDPGESPEDAGVRELREETGYAGDSVEILGFVSPNPAVQNNRCYTALVRGAQLVDEQNPDEHEELRVRLVGMDELPSLVERGIIHHAMVVSAFYHFARWSEAGG